MEKTMKKYLLGKITAAAVFGLTIGAAAQAAEPIKIGSVLSVTGPAAFLGDPELKTLELYLTERINAGGGVLGRKLELVLLRRRRRRRQGQRFRQAPDRGRTKSTSSSAARPPARPWPSLPLAEQAEHAVHLAGRRGRDRRAGQEVGVQDAAYRPHGREKIFEDMQQRG